MVESDDIYKLQEETIMTRVDSSLVVWCRILHSMKDTWFSSNLERGREGDLLLVSQGGNISPFGQMLLGRGGGII